eukprot:223414-Pelagomonas_calceolata.AAC.7
MHAQERCRKQSLHYVETLSVDDPSIMLRYIHRRDGVGGASKREGGRRQCRHSVKLLSVGGASIT